MTAILVSLALKFWPYIVGLLGLGLGALRWRSSIIKAERAKQAERVLKARTEAEAIDDAVAGMSDEEVIKRQAKWSRSKS